MTKHKKIRRHLRRMLTHKLFWSSCLSSLIKLNPLYLWRNPVMFITEIGALITTLEWAIAPNPFYAQISVWLWLTVLFANFSESMAEKRNEAQAESLRTGRVHTEARVRRGKELFTVPADTLSKGDIVVVSAGETIPGDGEIIEGMASIDESAITGESAPVIRAAGTDSSSVTGGTKVVSDEIIVRIAANSGHGFLDRMINLIESAERQKSQNEIAIIILFSGLTFLFLVVVVAMKVFGNYFSIDLSIITLVALLICLIPTTIAGLISAIGIAGISRLLNKNVLAMNGQAVEAAGDIDCILIDKTGTITHGHRRAFAIHEAPDTDQKDFIRALYFASAQDLTEEGRSIVTFLKEHHKKLPALPSNLEFIPFTAQTRMSGANAGKHHFRKGALDAVQKYVGSSLPKPLAELAKKCAEKGGTPLAVCENKEIVGLVLLKDTLKKGLVSLFEKFQRMGIQTVMLTGDNPLTAAAIAHEAGVSDFRAEVSPEQKLEILKQMQKSGKMVAMTGDGVNDAPALAHADVGIAMNSGTQAAKEAANMIDLDSHPEKLFEIIEIGKQMLMTRGALTAFSIANDVAKYFAIIPAMLTPYFPVMAALNIMHLQTSNSAVLSAVIFNALIIPILLPLAFRGVKFIPKNALIILRRNLTIYGIGGVVSPFIGIKLLDMAIHALGIL